MNIQGKPKGLDLGSIWSIILMDTVMLIAVFYTRLAAVWDTMARQRGWFEIGNSSGSLGPGILYAICAIGLLMNTGGIESLFRMVYSNYESLVILCLEILGLGIHVYVATLVWGTWYVLVPVVSGSLTAWFVLRALGQLLLGNIIPDLRK